jgi:hypothetical protein
MLARADGALTHCCSLLSLPLVLPAARMIADDPENAYDEAHASGPREAVSGLNT